MKKFWNFIRDESGGRVLRLEGPIDEDSFWGDEVTPDAFREELEAEDGDVTVWINSPGGNVFAAAQIYTMLCEHKGSITVKIDAIAASAASVIAMAGDRVLMSPVAMLMIHDPMTIAMGNAKDMEKAIGTLNEVKASIINAYQMKTGLSRNKISQLMEDETWMNAKKAVELGFADEVLFSKKDESETDVSGEEKQDGKEIEAAWKPYSTKAMGRAILNRIVLSAETDAGTGEEPHNAEGGTEDVEPAAEEVTAGDGTEDASDVEDAAVVTETDVESDGDAEVTVETEVSVEDAEDEPVGIAPNITVEVNVDLHGVSAKDDPEGDEEPEEDEAEGESPDEGESGDDESEGDEPKEDDPDEPDEEKRKDAPPDNEAKPPAIGLDGRAENGDMPYELLRKQLDFLK